MNPRILLKGKTVELLIYFFRDTYVFIQFTHLKFHAIWKTLNPWHFSCAVLGIPPTYGMQDYLQSYTTYL